MNCLALIFPTHKKQIHEIIMHEMYFHEEETSINVPQGFRYNSQNNKKKNNELNIQIFAKLFSTYCNKTTSVINNSKKECRMCQKQSYNTKKIKNLNQTVEDV